MATCTKTVPANGSDVRVGTHRVCGPEESWRRLEPLLPLAGITRVSDVTGLDDLGVPVWQAVRPNSWNLAVSQGKGITPALARISAAMESFELFCAERPLLPSRTGSAHSMRPLLTYDVGDLPTPPRLTLSPHAPMVWHEVEDLHEGTTTWMPADMVAVDLRVRGSWAPATTQISSNGLASGNTPTEATVHGLLELMERHALSVAARDRDMWDGAVRTLPGRHGASAEALRRCVGAGAAVEVVDITGDFGVPTFAARVWSPSVPWWFSGSGSHPDPDVALSRAVTEAAQSRLTVIAGARDDLARTPYLGVAPSVPARDAGPDAPTSDRLLAVHASPPTGTPAARDLDADLDALLATARRHGVPVLRADLTVPSFGIPVVRVLAPGLRFDSKAWS
ncbi:YcaO-like family protein [Streptomyces sp. NPDC004667]|uniref:YcaO-like family protein n=1 Tax=Streptomyces sp. NPDC004667 TaxID=3154285 RepID=UPI0033A266A8